MFWCGETKMKNDGENGVVEENCKIKLYILWHI